MAEVRWCPDMRDPKALAGRERLQNWSAAGPSHLLASVRLFGPMSSATRKVFTVIQQEAEGTASGGRGVNVLVRIKHNTSYPHLSLSDVGLRARPATGELALLHFPRDGLATVCFVAHGNPVRAGSEHCLYELEHLLIHPTVRHHRRESVERNM